MQIFFRRSVVLENKFVAPVIRAWVATPASRIEGVELTISLAVPSSCHSKMINALRYLWRETPCRFKEAAIYSGEDSDLPAPPYLHYF